MAKKKVSILTDLSTTDLKRLLAARERIDVLEKEKARLLKELGAVDKELAQLLGGGKTTRKKATRKKAAKKKAGRKKVLKKTTRKKTSRKTPVRKKTTRKKVVKKTTRKPRAAAGGKGRVTLEDVIVKVIKGNKGAMAFKDLKKTIVGGKLFKTKSANFDNVLRRTLSTSKAVKRVGRGVYDVA